MSDMDRKSGTIRVDATASSLEALKAEVQAQLEIKLGKSVSSFQMYYSEAPFECLLAYDVVTD